MSINKPAVAYVKKDGTETFFLNVRLPKNVLSYVYEQANESKQPIQQVVASMIVYCRRNQFFMQKKKKKKTSMFKDSLQRQKKRMRRLLKFKDS